MLDFDIVEITNLHRYSEIAIIAEMNDLAGPSLIVLNLVIK